MKNVGDIVLPPAEHGTHTRQQFAGRKGFGKIVVRPQIKPGNPVFDLRLRRKEKHRSPVTALPQRTQYRKPVHLRHHDIENDAVVVLFPGIGKRIGSVVDGIHGKIVILQNIRNSLRHGRLVLCIEKLHTKPPSAFVPTDHREEKRRASARLSMSTLRQSRGCQDTR